MAGHRIGCSCGAVASPKGFEDFAVDISLDGKVALVTGVNDAVLDDITWHNCFRFLGIDPPKLFSSRE